MRRDWIVGGTIAIGVGLLTWWIARHTYWDTINVPTPLKGEAATNPFYSAQRFAEALGASTERRDVLGNPPSTNAVIVLAFWHWGVVDSRRQALENWVEAGGRLIVDHTLSGAEDEFKRWSGIALERESRHATSKEHDEDEEQPEEATNFFGGKQGICKVLTASPESGGRKNYHVCNLAEDGWLSSYRPAMWALDDEGAVQVLRVRVGRGSVTMLNATPFGNRALLEVDHAALFAAATQLQRGDKIVFLSEEKRASLLAMLWSHAAPAIVVTLLLLIATLWRGGVRFGPLAAIPEAARRSIAEQIRGTGQFTLRFGGGRALHAAMVRALHETAARRIAGYPQLGSQERIAAIARVVEVDADKLAETIHYTGARRAGELRNAVLVLENARRRLLNETGVKGALNAS